MTNGLDKELSKYGFDAKESKIYVHLLKEGRSQVSELARQTNLPRTSLYLPLEGLEKHGLVNRVKVGNRYFWEAHPPQSIVRHMKENLSGLQSILPDLEGLAGSQKKDGSSELLFYKTKDGIKQVNRMILGLKSNERFYAVQGSGTMKFQKKFSANEVIEWQKAFRRSDVIGEVVVGEDILESAKGWDKEMLEAHLGRKVITYALPKALMSFDAQIYAFRDTVAIMTFEKNLTVIITSREIAQVFVSLVKIAESVGRKVDFNAEIAKIVSK